jgi:NDP-sugar pyrophosphorylase family protein
MLIVVPMSGHSRRFQAKGYDTPKAFLDVDGRPMIHWVCRMFSPESDRFIFVALKKHLVNPAHREMLRTAATNTEIVEIDEHELGPVFTSLYADDLVNDDEPVILSYCDGFQHWNYNRFLMHVNDYDGGMSVFRGFNYHMVGTPASFGDTYYAYIRANERLEMTELREKRSFTDVRHDEFASTGVYYTRSWELYRSYARRLLDRGLPVGNEYYASLIYNPLVQDGLRVALFEVDKFICWGTPEDFEEYVFWSRYFVATAVGSCRDQN